MMKNVKKISGRTGRSILRLVMLCFLFSDLRPVFADSVKNVEIETRGGIYENVTANTRSETPDDATVISSEAESYQTESGMLVDCEGEEKEYFSGDLELNEHYTALDDASGYEAEGWHDKTVTAAACDIPIELNISVAEDGMTYHYGEQEGIRVVEGDVKTSADDGRYDYSVSPVESQGRTGTL